MVLTHRTTTRATKTWHRYLYLHLYIFFSCACARVYAYAYVCMYVCKRYLYSHLYISFSPALMLFSVLHRHRAIAQFLTNSTVTSIKARSCATSSTHSPRESTLLNLPSSCQERPQAAGPDLAPPRGVIQLANIVTAGRPRETTLQAPTRVLLRGSSLCREM